MAEQLEIRARKKRGVPDPAEVFTPARPVRRDMFASRHYGRVQDRVEEALAEPGRQILLFGDTGVGKTSLVNHIVEVGKFRAVAVECGGTFEETAREALSKAGVTEDSVEQIDELKSHAGIRGTLGFLYAGGRHDLKDKVTRKTYPVSVQTVLRTALAAQSVDVLFLDNFENLEPKDHYKETATEISQLMKSFSDHGEGVKVVVAGIPHESEALIKLDAATARRTAQIEVPRMPDEELDDILRKGEAKLGLRFDEFARGNVLRFSDGFPYYTHLHALQAARQAIRAKSATVDYAHFESALDAILDSASLEVKQSYFDAVETTGTTKVRKSLLHAIARLEKQEVHFRDIKKSFQELHPDKYQTSEQLNTINPHLSELVDTYGVIQGRGTKRSADRTYRFANPMMRAYVLLMAERDRQTRLDV